MNRLLSAVTVFVLLSGSFGLFAAAQKECGCGTAPIVVVSGFATVPLVRDVGTDSEEQVWAPSGKIIINGVTGVLFIRFYACFSQATGQLFLTSRTRKYCRYLSLCAATTTASLFMT